MSAPHVIGRSPLPMCQYFEKFVKACILKKILERCLVIECLTINGMNEGPWLWTLALVWPIEKFIYEMSLQMSLFDK